MVRVELVTLLEEGAKLGLVDCELEEGDALHELKHVCLSTCLTGTAETGKASASDTYTDSDIGDFVNDILNTIHRKGQITRVIRRQSDIYVDDQHDQPCGNSERPPPIGIVVDAELMQEWGW